MEILEYFYNDHRILYIEFSTKEDKDKYYRILEFNVEEIEYYSPTIISEDDLSSIDEEFVIELIQQYLKENELPESLSL